MEDSATRREFKLGQIFEYYVDHLVVMSPTYYEAKYHEEPEYNTYFLLLKDETENTKILEDLRKEDSVYLALDSSDIRAFCADFGSL